MQAQNYWICTVAAEEKKESWRRSREKYKALKKWCAQSRMDSDLCGQQASRRQQSNKHTYLPTGKLRITLPVTTFSTKPQMTISVECHHYHVIAPNR